MINREMEQLSAEDQQQQLMIQSTVFEYKKYKDTIFVPVYPRAHVEEVIGIDHDRRTVTARFTIHLTVCLKGQEGDMKKYIRSHLILEFGFNQIIYIPELMMRDNPPYVIQEVIEPTRGEDYVTYKIKGNIECSANFDFLLFPYRQIEVINHLVIRSQEYKGHIIKYNAMMLLDNNCNFHQFSPHIAYPQFAGYTIINESAEIFTGESKYSIKQKLKNQNLVKYLYNFITNNKYNLEQKQQFQSEQISKIIFDMNNRDIQDNRDISSPENLVQLCPFKHVTFKFDMASDKIAFVLQNEIPIWMLGVVSLYLFTSKPDMGNRFGNAILIIVSMIALLTNFRVNNIQHHSITLYELKIMAVMVVPILLIISTTLDFYSSSDATQTSYALRTSQIENPFMLASIITYASFFTLSFLFFIYIMIYNCRQKGQVEEKLKLEKYDAGYLWQNLEDLKWGQPGLFKKLVDLLTKNGSSLEIKQKNVQNLLKTVSQRVKKTMKPLPSTNKKAFNPALSIVSEFDSTSNLPRNPY